MKHTIRVFLILLLSFGVLPISAQTWDEVKNNPNIYLWGEGFGETDEDADDAALKSLLSKISVEVSQHFDMTVDEQNTNGKIENKTYIQQKVETYSAATLTNTERVFLSREPKAHVVRWMKRAEVDKIFAGRITKVKEYFRLGQNAERNLKIDDALRYYYWAFSLLKSVPDNTKVKANVDGQEYSLIIYLPECLNQVFDNVSAKVSAIKGSEVTVDFSFRGQPVSSLDYTYFDGRDRSNIYSAKNGKGILELVPGAPTNNLQIQYEYIYRQEAANLDKETASVLKVIRGKGPGLRKSNVTISDNINTSPQSSKEVEVKSAVSIGNNPTGSNSFRLQNVESSGIYKANLDKVLSAISTHRYESVKDLFTPDGWDMYLRLVTYGKARLIGTKDCQFYPHGEYVVARSIPMAFSFKNGVRKAFVEDVVFTFTKEGKIDCLAFGLDAAAQKSLLNHPGEWSETARKSITEFLENYKTAYALKRLEYIKSIFDDDAVIIVGHSATRMVRTTGKDNLPNYTAHRAVTRTQYSKEQYMKNLENCFRSNEYVNIRFGDNEVIKGKGEIYGIQLKQDYYSSTYGDQGYLFLRVDLTNPKQPNISVRTWQPEPDPIDGLYSLRDF